MRYLAIILIVLLWKSPVFGENEFGFERIDFFGRIEVQEKSEPKEDTQSPEITVDEWAEPIISPSGRRSIYVPPKEVRDFLEKPNLENARAYLTWNLKRIKKFILAQELLRKEAKELEVMKEPKNLLKPTSSSSSNSQDRVGASYLFYFMSKGCPACEKESRVIEDIYLNHPEIRIEAFAEGFSDRELENFRFPTRQDNGISSLFKVNSYPTIAVFNKKKQKYFLSGFVDKNRILGLFK